MVSSHFFAVKFFLSFMPGTGQDPVGYAFLE